MTDITPAPTTPEPVEVMSLGQINEIERKLRENRAAVLRKEAPPHTVTKEEIRAAVMGIKMQRGTSNVAAAAGGSKGGKKSPPIQIDLGEMDL